MKRVCDESRISNKHFINDLSFKLNIKRNKIRLPKNSLLPHRFKVPCSQSIGPKNSKISRDAIKYLSGKIGKTENLFMAQVLKQSHIEGGGKKSICWELHISLQDIILSDSPCCLDFKNGKGLTGLRKYIHNQDFCPFPPTNIGSYDGK